MSKLDDFLNELTETNNLKKSKSSGGEDAEGNFNRQTSSARMSEDKTVTITVEVPESVAEYIQDVSDILNSGDYDHDGILLHSVIRLKTGTKSQLVLNNIPPMSAIGYLQFKASEILDEIKGRVKN